MEWSLYLGEQWDLVLGLRCRNWRFWIPHPRRFSGLPRLSRMYHLLLVLVSQDIQRLWREILWYWRLGKIPVETTINKHMSSIPRNWSGMGHLPRQHPQHPPPQIPHQAP